MSNTQKLKAYIYRLNWIVDVIEITNDIVEVNLGKDCGEAIYHTDELELLKCTNVKDMNGIEIYEYDKVKIYYSYPYNAKEYYVRITDKGIILASMDNLKLGNGTETPTSFLRLTEERAKIIKVIGNLYLEGE